MKKLFVVGVICLLCSISIFSQSKKEWERVQTSNSTNVYQQFILVYPNGKYTELAKQKLAQLKENEVNKKEIESNKPTQMNQNDDQKPQASKKGQNKNKPKDPIYPDDPMQRSATKNVNDIVESTGKYRTLQGNSVFLEGAGNAFTIGSLNYERMLLHSNNIYMSARIGFGFEAYDKNDSSNSHYYFLPVLLNLQFQLSNSFIIEIGGGPTLAHDSWEENSGSWKNQIITSRKEYYHFITALIGIRVQTKSGFLFRTGFTPIFNKYKDTFIPFVSPLPYAGLSIGYSFGK